VLASQRAQEAALLDQRALGSGGGRLRPDAHRLRAGALHEALEERFGARVRRYAHACGVQPRLARGDGKRVVERAECVHEPDALRVRAAPHAALRDGVHLGSRKRPAGGDFFEKVLVGGINGALQKPALPRRERAREAPEVGYGAGRHLVEGDAELVVEKRVGVEENPEDADGAGQRRRIGHERVGSGGEPVAPGGGVVAHRDDHRLLAGRQGGLAAHRLAGRGRAARRVDPQNHRVGTFVFARFAHRLGESLGADLRGRVAEVEVVRRLAADDPAVGVDDGHAPAARLQARFGARDARVIRQRHVFDLFAGFHSQAVAPCALHLVAVAETVDEARLCGIRGRQDGALLGEVAESAGVAVPPGGDGLEKLRVLRVEHFRKLLAVGSGEVVADERLDGAFVGAGAHDLRLHPQLLKGALVEGDAGDEAVKLEGRLRGGEDAVGGGGQEVPLLPHSEVGGGGDHRLAALLPELLEGLAHLLKRRPRGRDPFQLQPHALHALVGGGLRQRARHVAQVGSRRLVPEGPRERIVGRGLGDGAGELHPQHRPVLDAGRLAAARRERHGENHKKEQKENQTQRDERSERAGSDVGEKTHFPRKGKESRRERASVSPGPLRTALVGKMMRPGVKCRKGGGSCKGAQKIRRPFPAAPRPGQMLKALQTWPEEPLKAPARPSGLVPVLKPRRRGAVCFAALSDIRSASAVRICAASPLL